MPRRSYISNVDTLGLVMTTMLLLTISGTLPTLFIPDLLPCTDTTIEATGGLHAVLASALRRPGTGPHSA
ncbi:MAG: hypothetical protein AVDCRST_MAG26-3953 [uncultured Chloroflexia bacterium]|uniref:Uncharacterized protein n=1 Tax=uncultured Chloroflexia bacterium TaxID=1672391 RepID=A0A6J4JVW5_9CHLR|nr:MAG: hypothetical protein AVDCRST_MAG26-3953 [uncultured Chloroflexia bacterium]